eukprot:1161049-Pelagomonas_calceolata.AAC.7
MPCYVWQCTDNLLVKLGELVRGEGRERGCGGGEWGGRDAGLWVAARRCTDMGGAWSAAAAAAAAGVHASGGDLLNESGCCLSQQQAWMRGLQRWTRMKRPAGYAGA